MTLPHLRELAQASGLQIQRVHSLLRFCHAQTFVVLTKTYSTGSRPRIDSQRDAPPLPRWLYSVRAGTTNRGYTLFYACVLLCSSRS